MYTYIILTSATSESQIAIWKLQRRGLENTTETELKLTLLLYNMLSKERAKTADMCAHTCDYGK